MAKVVVKVTGGTPTEIDACTVGDIKKKFSLLNHTASVNQEPAADDYRLNDDDYVSLAPAVKGA